MNPGEVIVEGVVRPDGALEVRERIRLAPGPVLVIIQPLPAAAPPRENWWQYLQRARAEAEAEGGPFRSEEEIEAARAAFREE